MLSPVVVSCLEINEEAGIVGTRFDLFLDEEVTSTGDT
jgi:hypothetical protein